MLALGRLGEIIVQIVPLMLGDGVRLFDEAPGPEVRLERTHVGSSGRLTDIRLRNRRAADGSERALRRSSRLVISPSLP